VPPPSIPGSRGPARPRLFCDLDGVLTDFDKGARAVDPSLPGLHLSDPATFWRLVAAKGETFWSELSWLPDGRALWDFLRPYRPVILTGVPEQCQDCVRGKRVWIARELGPEHAAAAIICPSRDKRLHAVPDAVLIDDTPAVVEAFRRAGGRAILHRSAGNTIRELRRLLRPDNGD
jgi:hypothetical protein